jgi:hypothetical protein
VQSLEITCVTFGLRSYQGLRSRCGKPDPQAPLIMLAFLDFPRAAHKRTHTPTPPPRRIRPRCGHRPGLAAIASPYSRSRCSFLFDSRDAGPKTVEVALRTNAIFATARIGGLDVNGCLTVNVITPACVDRSDLESRNG